MKRNYDIVVVGAGPAGITTAIGAAHFGARVALIEKDAVLGGMCTAGLLNCWCGRAESRMMRKIAASGQNICPEENMEDWQRYEPLRRVYDPEIMKNVFLEETVAAGVELLLHSTFLDATEENGRITSVRIVSPEGVEEISAEIFIDATGDGYLAAAVGVPYTLGNAEGLFQPMTTMFTVAGVDESCAIYKSTPALKEKMDLYLACKQLDGPVGHIILVPGYQRGTASVNMTNITHCNGLLLEDRTKAEILTRKQIPQILEFLRNCVPGFANAWVSATGSYAGIRETRHFMGEYVLQKEDILQQRVFSNWIVSNASYHFGDHSTIGANYRKDESLTFGGLRYTMPLTCFVVKEVKNLMLAGRCASGTPQAHASFRVMPICMAMGEGVGITAALAHKNRCNPEQVRAKDVQQILTGVYDIEPPRTYNAIAD